MDAAAENLDNCSRDGWEREPAAAMAAHEAPEFFLYGEAPREVEPHFLHLESLDERNRPANWNIRPHSHGELHHLFFIASGGGRMLAEGCEEAFAAPCLVLVPAGCVHGFACAPGTRGQVLTIARGYMEELVDREAALSSLLAATQTFPLKSADGVEDTVARLQRELVWTAPGHALAAESLLVGLLIEALRARQFRPETSQAHGPAAALLSRFRALIEANYRQDMSLADYALALRVTAKRLRACCGRVAGCTPLDVIQDRRLLEAKRLMLYSNLSVSEAAYYLGFSDPAYFSRFFSRRCGVSPRAFRDARAA
jgi:AraC family transcriptional activator of pobA